MGQCVAVNGGNPKKAKDLSYLTTHNQEIEVWKQDQIIQDEKKQLEKFSESQTQIFTIQKDIFSKKYKLTKEILGKGEFGLVGKAIRKVSIKNWEQSHEDEKKVVAIKAIAKQRLDQDMIKHIRSEMKILNTLDHPNIIKYYEDFENDTHIFLVMELFEGGTLYEKMIKLVDRKKTFSEFDACLIIEKLLRAIAFCHENNICHRDLKPENILINQNLELKIIDFGLSKQRNRNLRVFKTRVGSPSYIAPEVLQTDQYGFECDIWSIGVILYVLVSGYMPFGAKSMTELLAKVKKGYYDFRAPTFDKVSSQCMDLISKMMSFYPKNRPIASKALQHEWFKINQAKISKTVIEKDVLLKLVEYRNIPIVKRAALKVIIRTLDDAQTSFLRSQFLALDQLRCGLVDINSIKDAFDQVNIPADAETLESVVESVSCNKTAKINYSEFLAATIDMLSLLTEENLWMLFKFIDKEDQNEIDFVQIEYILKQLEIPYKAKELQNLLNNFSKQKPNKLVYDEFKEMLLCDDYSYILENINEMQEEDLLRNDQLLQSQLNPKSLIFTVQENNRV
ncbi:calcium-dependent protein [Stylonychia lemnae]|uniref:Calcium-dependent protein n=1 Tax=Stylonychia lemnae TaxID=5949 RepID=A0A078AK33_STYLE|nr:calcium-dependent protein [Stylonychia lemnae]|eukprot:CDW82534.1 calcium-dependent protein [Stylonychia lemnae]